MIRRRRRASVQLAHDFRHELSGAPAPAGDDVEADTAVDSPAPGSWWSRIRGPRPADLPVVDAASLPLAEQTDDLRSNNVQIAQPDEPDAPAR